MGGSSPTDLSENPGVALPPAPQYIAKEHPDVWAAVQQLAPPSVRRGHLMDEPSGLSI